MKFGMPVLIENSTLEGNIALCKECGLDFIELNVNFPDYSLQALMDTDRFRRAAEENGIFFTLHLDEYLNFCDFNPIVAEAHMETVRRTIECAKKIGIRVLNMHMVHGTFTTLPGQITVPAATYTQDPDTGVYTIQPGVSVITVTGTV